MIRLPHSTMYKTEWQDRVEFMQMVRISCTGGLRVFAFNFPSSPENRLAIPSQLPGKDQIYPY